MPIRKIINDPVYGFVTIPSHFILDIIDHPWFQRLRHIRQLGLTHYVYPGALHTRFHHALGAMHLMSLALEVIKSKGTEVTDEEGEAAMAAILLHDIGHGPFSHALEHVFIPAVNHEEITSTIMRELDKEFGGRLGMAISIFDGTHPKPFLHQLVGSQLDVDRLDYLNRDSFFTGVSEGVIGYDRIIKMLQVHNGQLVVEQKGIYSIEKFLIARRLMYWQVYLHKTVLVTEMMIRNIFRRVSQIGLPVTGSNGLNPLISTPRPLSESLDDFLQLDDYDVMVAIKSWQHSRDKVLADLCHRLMNRQLLRIEWLPTPANEATISNARLEYSQESGMTDDEASYFVFGGSTRNHAYSPDSGPIGILYRDGRVVNITEASDLTNISSLTEPVVKFYLCRPKSRTDQ